MRSTILILTLLLCNCAQTVFYHNGEKVAKFQADMKATVFARTPDGAITWSAQEVDHSTATKAQGEAATGKINAVAAGVAGMAMFGR